MTGAAGFRSLASLLGAAPLSSDPTEADRRFRDWWLTLEPASPLRDCFGREPVRSHLLALADHSPFLWRLVLADPARLFELLDADPDETVSRVVDDSTLR